MGGGKGSGKKQRQPSDEKICIEKLKSCRCNNYTVVDESTFMDVSSCVAIWVISHEFILRTLQCTHFNQRAQLGRGVAREEEGGREIYTDMVEIGFLQRQP